MTPEPLVAGLCQGGFRPRLRKAFVPKVLQWPRSEQLP